ncbi:NAD(P)-dependent oxidoreductase [Actinomadura sp. ATCC 31491]|uniref:NAD(P)-dependent oxidoreductase n=1 Tax=Actinomadura luzonensis TaxID=2805427 RepID=A0ABT0FQW3_9ACTN|nr:NAD(P)-dependent oxidoreductase [Actinomadura luzonensis]MCK2214734.1 NAD(P)-dependent oxidoreductase [Actinomadura luzonensis]
MSTVVVFGATGFLGRPVAELLEGDARVTRLVRPRRAELDLLTAAPADVADLLAAARPAAVLNCVGRLSGGYDELLRGNAGVAAVLLEAVALAVPRARLVRLGSAAEYGPALPGARQREDGPARPTGAYGISHLAGTLLVERAREVDAMSLRVFNPVGPGVSAGNVLGRVLELIGAATGDVEVGPLGAVRDFVDVRDVARAVVRAAFAAEPAERVVNVGSGRAVLVREAVALLAEATGFTGEIRESAPAPGRSDADWSQADTGRAERVLGWRATVPLTESIKAMSIKAMSTRATA